MIDAQAGASLRRTYRPSFGPIVSFLAETSKLTAFVRRDFLTMLSYRMSFVSDLAALAGQVIVFYFIGRLVDPSKLPTYNGRNVSYFEFAVVGVALGLFIHFALERVSSAIRAEQFMGTLESLLMTSTRLLTVQLGSVAFDFIYVPLRMAVFVAAMSLAFGLHISAAGMLPAFALLVCFAPLVWGLGLAGAAAVMTFRRGGGMVTFGGVLVGLVSGVYFPVVLLPHWIASAVDLNPVAVTIDAFRNVLLGDAGWGAAVHAGAFVLPCSVAAIAFGVGMFNAALRRERRRGTLGMY